MTNDKTEITAGEMLDKMRSGEDSFILDVRIELLGFIDEDVLGKIPEAPEAYQIMRNVNMGLIKPEEDKQELWEPDQNRCAIEAAKAGER